MSSSSPYSFHIKKPSKANTNIDDLSLVKAAAWANWCEEFDISSNKKAQEPSSRYKLQVINKEVQELSQYSSNVLVPIVQLSSTSNYNSSTNNNNNISLLDNYEIERISSQLDQYIETSQAHHEKKIEKKIKIFKGFFRYRMMMNMCGSSSHHDVVVVERRVFSNPQSPEKYFSPVPVVKFASCRPSLKLVKST
ncbi:hypothetical protein RND71_009248 [Anisodus tanguticus]|uniref:Uncharacterized protein n=1 Tax=Anisodus tanguticus TaxID=243964 RepID=A0AAE1VH26_9SOLA|nr:hypothetical protein RND71_009248 [Anisodus tanguticus]